MDTKVGKHGETVDFDGKELLHRFSDRHLYKKDTLKILELAPEKSKHDWKEKCHSFETFWESLCDIFRL